MLTACHCRSVGGRLPQSGAAAWITTTATAAHARSASKYLMRVWVVASGTAPPSHHVDGFARRARRRSGEVLECRRARRGGSGAGPGPAPNSPTVVVQDSPYTPHTADRGPARVPRKRDTRRD